MKFLTLISLISSLSLFAISEQEVLELNQDSLAIEYNESAQHECVYYGKSHQSNSIYGTFYRDYCYEARSACEQHMQKYRNSISDTSCETKKYWNASATCTIQGWKNGRLNRTYSNSGYADSKATAERYACNYAMSACKRSGNAYCRHKH